MTRCVIECVSFVFRVMGTVRLQLVRGNPGVRTWYGVGKLRPTDDWQQPFIGLLETLKDTTESQ